MYMKICLMLKEMRFTVRLACTHIYFYMLAFRQVIAEKKCDPFYFYRMLS